MTSYGHFRPLIRTFPRHLEEEKLNWSPQNTTQHCPSHLDNIYIFALSAVPHVLTELGLAGIYAMIKFPDTDGRMPYAEAKEVGRLIRKVKPYCEWSAEDGWEPPADPKEGGSEEINEGGIQAGCGVTHGGETRRVQKGTSNRTQERDDGENEEEEEEDEEICADPNEVHYIDAMMAVFEAVVEGGCARN
ncbi:hypothetical protein C8R43DRAFT_1160692 [Mycena crocata]|nr:hypothetical protein C8R43DRAFT_1160692 [Mycena crocata]